nr:unnamed protein product [Callosobruchus chinensis]
MSREEQRTDHLQTFVAKKHKQLFHV